MPTKSRSKGFTLIELLIVIALIGILAGIFIMVMNPNKQLAKSRNARRRVDLHTISMAVYQYTLDTGDFPPTLPANPTEICRENAPDCSGLVDLSILLANQKYLIEVPIDPFSATTNSSGYSIYKNPNGRVLVSAPYAENGEVIVVIR